MYNGIITSRYLMSVPPAHADYRNRIRKKFCFIKGLLEYNL